jgi:hypothetical protein
MKRPIWAMPNPDAPGPPGLTSMTPCDVRVVCLIRETAIWIFRPPGLS